MRRACCMYSLKLLLAGLTLAAVWLGLRVHHALRQRAAIAAILSVDGYYYYDYQYEPPETYHADRDPPGPAWMWRVVDPNLFFDIVAAGLNSKPATDETLRLVASLHELQQLDLAAADKVSDDGLRYIAPLKRLNYLRLDGASVSDDAIQRYEQSHPGVAVVR